MYRQSKEDNINIILIIIAANVLVYIAEIVHGGLIYDFGLQPATWLEERPWTLVTNMFIHGSMWHLFGNMLSLFFLGRFLTVLIGEAKLLLIYLLGGIVGNLVYVALAPEYSIAIGASGAIFALGGALVALRPNVRVFVIPIPAPVPLWAAIFGSFAIMSLLPRVAWQAHLGGLVFGLIAGYLLRSQQRSVIF